MSYKVIERDVVVVGHGLAGLAAAITAKEDNPNLSVLTLDKGSVGYAGKANKGGGHVAFIPEGAEETYVEYHTRTLGDYLNDQDMLRIYANSTHKTMERWESWGVEFVIPKEEAFNAHPIIPWKVTIVDADIMVHMGRHAKKIGVESLEKVALVDLFVYENEVRGVLAMDMLTGETMVLCAKTVILANGNQNWKIARMWSSSRGDGIAAAYRAGAKLRNAEFGSFVNMMSANSKVVAYGAENVLTNVEGGKSTDRGDLDERLQSAIGGADLGGTQSVFMLMDVRDGKGPIYEDTEKNDFIGSFIGRNLGCWGGKADPPFYRPHAQKFWDRLFYKNRQDALDEGNLQEVIPVVVGEQSPLYVDHNMKTSVNGLYGAGDICANGSAWSGAVPTPPGRNRGSGLIHAVWSAILAGTNAAEDAVNKDQLLEINKKDIEEKIKNIQAPLNLSGKTYSPEDIIWEVQNCIQPVEYSGYKEERRMKEALQRILDVKAKLPYVKPDTLDPHGLIAVNECKSIVLCAEIFFRTSLARKESRGWHVREDYAKRDDDAFLKWIVVQDDNGEVSLSYEDLPMDKYQYKPE